MSIQTMEHADAKIIFLTPLNTVNRMFPKGHLAEVYRLDTFKALRPKKEHPSQR